MFLAKKVREEIYNLSLFTDPPSFYYQENWKWEAPINATAKQRRNQLIIWHRNNYMIYQD